MVKPFLWEKLPQADLVLRIRETGLGGKRTALLSQLKQLKKLDYKERYHDGTTEKNKEHTSD